MSALQNMPCPCCGEVHDTTACHSTDHGAHCAVAVGSASDPVCGHCGKRLSRHYHENEIYCFDNTTGDIFTLEAPGACLKRWCAWCPELGLLLETAHESRFGVRQNVRRQLYWTDERSWQEIAAEGQWHEVEVTASFSLPNTKT